MWVTPPASQRRMIDLAEPEGPVADAALIAAGSKVAPMPSPPRRKRSRRENTWLPPGGTPDDFISFPFSLEPFDAIQGVGFPSPSSHFLSGSLYNCSHPLSTRHKLWM